jgi:hypothetical protein
MKSNVTFFSRFLNINKKLGAFRNLSLDFVFNH